MSWLQLELETGKDQAETIAELLEQLGAVSVTLTAASDEPVFDEFEQERHLWQRTSLKTLLHPDTDLDILLVCVRDRIGADNIFHHRITSLPDKDWVGEFKSGHEPVLFADRIWITPSWCETPDSPYPSITLDPGLAFGTGAHPTTSLCIRWLAEHDLSGKTVIDYGCGSGILAMVAAKLGADPVYAIDIDAQAIEAAEANINRNNLSEHIQTGLPGKLALPVADIVVANILMNPLKELVTLFSSLTKPGGDLVLSGILHTQAEECLASYASCFTMNEPMFDAEWTRLHGVRKQVAD